MANSSAMRLASVSTDVSFGNGTMSSPTEQILVTASSFSNPNVRLLTASAKAKFSATGTEVPVPPLYQDRETAQQVHLHRPGGVVELADCLQIHPLVTVITNILARAWLCVSSVTGSHYASCALDRQFATATS